MSRYLFVKREKAWQMLLCLIIVVAFWVMPPIEPITPIGMKVIGIFISVVILLSIVDTVWPSMLALVLISQSGADTLNKAIAGSFGSWIIYFVFMSFVMTHALNESGFTDRLANRFIALKFVNKSPWIFTFSLGFLGLLLGCFLDQVIATAFMLAFSKKVYKELGYGRGEEYPMIANIICIFGVNIGGAMTPISHSLVILGLGIYEGITGQTINLFKYMAFGIPTGLVMFILVCLMFKIFAKPDFHNFKNFDISKIIENEKPMEMREKVVVFIFFATVVMWLLPGLFMIVMPSAAITTILKSYGITYWAIIAVVLMSIITIDNKPLIDIKSVVNKHTNWGILLFISIGVYLGAVVSAKNTGVSQFITERIVPLISDAPSTMIVILFAACTVLMTNLASNVTTITVMTGVGVALAVSSGSVDPVGIALLTAFCGSSAFLLPSSFAPIAMLHGDEYSNSGMIIRYGFLTMIITVLGVCFLGYNIVI